MDDFGEQLRSAAPRPERRLDHGALTTTARRRQRNRRGLVGLGAVLIIGLVAVIAVRDGGEKDSTLVSNSGLTIDRVVECAIKVSGDPNIETTVRVDFNEAPVTHTVGAYMFVFSVVPALEPVPNDGEPFSFSVEIRNEERLGEPSSMSGGVPKAGLAPLAFGYGGPGVRMECAEP